MINFNGTISENSTINIEENRGFLYGDALFETIKVTNNSILYFEYHYFRLMASMRMVRMEIPMNFTMDFLQAEIFKLINASNPAPAYRIRITVFRKFGGIYTPKTRDIDFLIALKTLENPDYQYNKSTYEVELYKDFYIPTTSLASLKTNNKMVHITGSIFAQENGYQNCILLNTDKNVVETLQENLFMLKDNQVITPPLSEGCCNGIMRKQVLKHLQKTNKINVIEQPISTFDLQKADELFMTNVIKGIQPITQFRKKTYTTHFSQTLFEELSL